MSAVRVTQAVVRLRLTVEQAPTVLLSTPARPLIKLIPTGERGPAGQAGSVPDPGDLTLIFENQLI